MHRPRAGQRSEVRGPSPSVPAPPLSSTCRGDGRPPPRGAGGAGACGPSTSSAQGPLQEQTPPRCSPRPPLPRPLASFLACELGTETSRGSVLLLSSPGLSLSVCPSTFPSAEPPPAKTDPNPEADERAAAGREQGPGPRRGPALEGRRGLGVAGAVAPTPPPTSARAALQAGAVRALGAEAAGSPAVGPLRGDLGRLVTRQSRQG